MDNKKKNIKLSALATGTLMLGAFTAGHSNAAELSPLEDLGTGAELRSELLATTNPIALMDNREIELKCGEGTCGEKSEKDKDKKAEASDDKAGEHKCGEGKCGEKGEKTEKKAEKKEKKEAKAAEDKAGEHKCGEGKCGE